MNIGHTLGLIASHTKLATPPNPLTRLNRNSPSSPIPGPLQMMLPNPPIPPSMGISNNPLSQPQGLNRNNRISPNTASPVVNQGLMSGIVNSMSNSNKEPFTNPLMKMK